MVKIFVFVAGILNMRANVLLRRQNVSIVKAYTNLLTSDVQYTKFNNYKKP